MRIFLLIRKIWTTIFASLLLPKKMEYTNSHKDYTLMTVNRIQFIAMNCGITTLNTAALQMIHIDSYRMNGLSSEIIKSSIFMHEKTLTLVLTDSQIDFPPLWKSMNIQHRPSSVTPVSHSSMHSAVRHFQDGKRLANHLFNFVEVQSFFFQQINLVFSKVTFIISLTLGHKWNILSRVETTQMYKRNENSSCLWVKVIVEILTLGMTLGT